MIARFWTAKIAQAHAHVYADHLKSHVLNNLRKVDGYIGAKLLERETSGGVEIVVITLWQSLDSITKFAGADVEKAVVSDDIVSLFLQYDQRVRHYKVVVTDDPQHGEKWVGRRHREKKKK
jgi:heme-degrading monooxygenase HmoA